jgi:cell division protein FtsQ
MIIQALWDSPELLSRVTKLLLGIALVLIGYAALHYLIELPALPLREVRVTGEFTHVTGEELKAVAQRELKGNFLTIDLIATRESFQKLPWVRSVAARRHWPDGLEVEIEEHVALARWGESALVNTFGELFNASYEGVLPLFTGPESSVKEITGQHARFQRLLTSIDQRAVAVHLSPRRAWRIHVDNGLTLELGREGIEPRLARFVSVYPRTIQPLKRRLDLVDLRYSNGFAVRIPELAGKPKNRTATARLTGKNG